MSEICQRIYDECQRKDVSLTKVMGDAGLSISMFYKWKDGTSAPRGRSVKAIARALGIPASTLSPELSDDVEVTAQASALQESRDDSTAGEDFVFVGMRMSAFKTLRPFIDRVNAGLVEVPGDLTEGLRKLLQAGVSGRTSL